MGNSYICVYACFVFCWVDLKASFFLTAYRAEYKKVGSTFASLSAAFAIDEDSESKEFTSHIYLHMNSALLTC